MSEFTVITQSYVNLTIQAEGREYGVEKRYAKDVFIADLKNKLEIMTGYVAGEMKLKLLNKEKKLVCPIDNDEKMLGFYPVEDGYILEVTGSKTVLGAPVGDEDPNVQKFELSEEEYAKRKGTMKEFKLKNKLGQYSDEAAAQDKEKLAREKLETEKKAIDAMSVGARCKVSIPNAPTRLGTVMYLGQLGSKPGYFVGVKYDEPLGKNDGSVDGKRYFECLPNYGGFVKPDAVCVGDFPEENFDEI
jgi:tubulin-folding cofactor B